VKSSFLKYLLLISKQGKNVPLSLEERVALIKALLNTKIKDFDFDVLDSPKRLNFSPQTFIWDKIFDDLWVHLSAQCPNLETIREMRPGPLTLSSLNELISTFKNLVRLETNCSIDTGKRNLNLNAL